MARNCLRRPVFSFGCNLTFSDMATVAVQGCLLHHSILPMTLTITGCFRAYNPAIARNCLRRPVFSFGCNLTGLSLTSLNSLDDVDNNRMFQSLQSFSLHHFLSLKLKFFHGVESLSPCLVRILLAIHVYPFVII